MIYDEIGLPKPTGASDWLDSSCVAGLCTLFEFGPKIKLSWYVSMTEESYEYKRHPNAPAKPDFSRDQYLGLSAGLWKAGFHHSVNESWITGRDILSPANKGHTLRCQGKQASWFQNLWLKAEILFHAKFTPLDEPNQLIAMMMVAGPEYLKLWVRHNKEWARSIRKYWYTEDGHWRQEPELAEFVIQKIESLTK